MSPVVRKTMGNAALLALLAALGGGAVQVYRKYGSLNPYGNLGHAHTADPTAQVTAKGIKVREYHDGKLVTQADADRLTMDQSGNRIVLDHIKNGVSKTPQGPMQFAGGKGILNPLSKTIEVSQGVRVKGGDFDIASSMATLNGRTGDVNVPTPLKGTLRGKIGNGSFSALSMIHRNNSDYTKVVALRYDGTVAATGAPAAYQGKIWHFAADDFVREKGLETHNNAQATDGELIVTAPKIVRDPKTEVITATGNGQDRATYRSAKADIVADKVVVYRNEHKAVCTGHVLVYVRPKKDWDKPLPKVDADDRGPLVPDIPPALMAKMGEGGKLSDAEKAKVEELRSSKNLRDYPMQMSGEEVTYWYQEGERHAIVKNGKPTAFQKFEDGRWRQVWAPEAHYDGEKDMLEMIGSPNKREVIMKNSLADNNECFWAKMSTKEDQTEADEYLAMHKAKALGTDFDADQPATAKPGAAPPAKAPPVKGASGG